GAAVPVVAQAPSPPQPVSRFAASGQVAGAKADSPWRLALVSSSPSEPINNLLELAQAKLSREPNLELLERQTIRKLLAEQQLSLSGLVDSNRAVEVGKLL